MAAALWWAVPLMADRYGGSVIERAWSLSALVALGLVVFFGFAWVLGALDKDLIAQVRRKRRAQPVNLSE